MIAYTTDTIRELILNIDALKHLNQFTGGDTHYRGPFGLLHTEGVKFLADNADCWWLIDAIASYQPQVMKDRHYQEFQVWKLVAVGSLGILTCRKDSDQKPTIEQKIPYTDFPLPEITLWVEGGVLILPSEH